LAKRLNVQHIAAGDVLRAEVAAETPLGRKVADLMERGDLVPDGLIVELLMPQILAAARAGGYLVDGFPRTLEQAQQARPIAAAEGAEPHAVIYLDVPEDELMRRLLARAQIEGRADDNEETVMNRLRVFDQATKPLVDYYRGRGLLRSVNAARSEDDVTDEILAVLPPE
jgi:adenylate kinase